MKSVKMTHSCHQFLNTDRCPSVSPSGLNRSPMDRKKHERAHSFELAWMSLLGWDELHPRMKGTSLASINIYLVGILLKANESSITEQRKQGGTEGRNWRKGIQSSLVRLGPYSAKQTAWAVDICPHRLCMQPVAKTDQSFFSMWYSKQTKVQRLIGKIGWELNASLF